MFPRISWAVCYAFMDTIHFPNHLKSIFWGFADHFAQCMWNRDWRSDLPEMLDIDGLVCTSSSIAAIDILFLSQIFAKGDVCPH